MTATSVTVVVIFSKVLFWKLATWPQLSSRLSQIFSRQSGCTLKTASERNFTDEDFTEKDQHWG